MAVVPPKLFKREIIRPKYRRKADREQAPVVAPAPKRAVAGGYASAELLAWIALSKYVDHAPLYRLEQMSTRWGATLRASGWPIGSASPPSGWSRSTVGLRRSYSLAAIWTSLLDHLR